MAGRTFLINPSSKAAAIRMDRLFASADTCFCEAKAILGTPGRSLVLE